jgi:hypothetical protein
MQQTPLNLAGAIIRFPPSCGLTCVSNALRLPEVDCLILLDLDGTPALRDPSVKSTMLAQLNLCGVEKALQTLHSYECWRHSTQVWELMQIE